MLRRSMVHLKDNVVAYLALFLALGGTSYAAVRLTPGSVTSRALARGAVTHSKLAANSISGKNVIRGTLTGSAFAKGTLSAAGALGGSAGPAGPAGPAGADGSAAIIARARATGSVGAPHAASTSVPVNGGTWSQDSGDIALVTGSATITTPASCTGSFGNSLLIQVDGAPATFAAAPTAPASTTMTVPIAVMAVMEPSGATTHRVTASLANSCTKGGEDYGVSDLKLDVVKFK